MSPDTRPTLKEPKQNWSSLLGWWSMLRFALHLLNEVSIFPIHTQRHSLSTPLASSPESAIDYISHRRVSPCIRLACMSLAHTHSAHMYSASLVSASISFGIARIGIARIGIARIRHRSHSASLASASLTPRCISRYGAAAASRY